MKLNKIEVIGAFIIIIVLFCFMLYTFISTINALMEKDNIESKVIDFSKIYSFENNSNNIQPNIIKKETIINKYKNIVNNLKLHLQTVTSNHLIYYEKFIESSYLYNKIIGFSLVSNFSDKTRVEISDGYYSMILKKKDVSEVANNLIEFKEYLEKENTDFLYIQVPYKIAETQKISSIYKDYSNENMNDLLKAIGGKVDYIDLRENIKNNNLNHLKLFFKTDHHWLPTTGLWATNEISLYLNYNYNMNLKIDNIKANNFNVKTYENIFLGTDGRYVSLANTELEDFDLITPKADTKLTIKIPDKGIFKTDKYENTIIDWSQLKYDNDYYNSSIYTTYLYGDRQLIEIHNEYVNNNKKILLIKDSFSDVVIPFLALENEYLSVIDLRHFNGSLKTYIKEYKPDLVIIMYNASMIVELNEEDSENIKMWQFN